MRKLVLAGLAVLLLATGSCGYNFRGRLNNLPPDIRTVAVPVFQNRTGEVRIESIFTDETVFQFTRSQILRVVNEGQADVILKGDIVRVDIQDVALTSSQASSQRRVTVQVFAKLVRRSDGTVLWQDKRLTQRQTYSVAGSAQATDTNKQKAIQELARTLAQTLHDRIFENF